MKAESYNNEQRALSVIVQSLGVLITSGGGSVWSGVVWGGGGVMQLQQL